MADDLRKGYMGYGVIAGYTTRLSSCNISAKQDVLFYTHTIGLNDSGFSGSQTKGESIGSIQPQKIFGRPSPCTISGSISFPISDGFQSAFDSMRKGEVFTITVNYGCGFGRTFTGCRANSISFNITAGDFATATVDVLAMDETDASAGTDYRLPQKFITWDVLAVTANGAGVNTFYGLNFQVNNSAFYIYTAKDSNTIAPLEIRLGTQEVTGTVMGYLGSGHKFVTRTSSPGSVSVSSSVFSADMKVMWKSDLVDSVTGPVVISVPFIGVDDVFNF